MLETLMDLLSDLAEWSMLAFTLVLFLAQLLAREIGAWVGRRQAARGPAEIEGVGTVVGGMLGLLGFVLALTLSFSTTRFQDSQTGTLAEANAIGTAWLRAQAIDHPRAAEIGRLLEAYTRERAAFVKAPRSGPAVDAINARTAALQTAIWGQMTAIVRERPDPLTTGLMAALNETFDAGTAQRFALTIRTPRQMTMLLLGMTVFGIGALGYQLGLKGRPFRVLSTLLIAMWTTIIVVILDLGAPRLGVIHASTAAYEWTLQGFQGGIPIPPPPAPR